MRFLENFAALRAFQNFTGLVSLKSVRGPPLNPLYFDYLFYIDFEASMADPRAQNALGHLQAIIDFWPLVMTFFMIIGSNDIKVSLYEDNRDLVFLYFCAGVCYISSRPWLLSHGCNSIARVSFACFPSFCSFPIQLVAEQSIHFGRDCWSTAATLSRSFEPFEFWPGEVSVGMTWSIKEIFKEK
ncbi:hypothetical protein WN944_010931 [Citrus x changshan-huyou]|uniref:Uncharacterized protein n=1 Tax=Citrus x changshan-huyou TaxID=2935761 RepID=A0AAP0MSI4_9ROSI